jgi:hypothetical protein
MLLLQTVGKLNEREREERWKKDSRTMHIEEQQQQQLQHNVGVENVHGFRGMHCCSSLSKCIKAHACVAVADQCFAAVLSLSRLRFDAITDKSNLNLIALNYSLSSGEPHHELYNAYHKQPYFDPYGNIS